MTYTLDLLSLTLYFLMHQHVGLHWATCFLARIGFGPAIFGPVWAQAPILTYFGPFLTNYSVIFA